MREKCSIVNTSAWKLRAVGFELEIYSYSYYGRRVKLNIKKSKYNYLVKELHVVKGKKSGVGRPNCPIGRKCRINTKISII